MNLHVAIILTEDEFQQWRAIAKKEFGSVKYWRKCVEAAAQLGVDGEDLADRLDIPLDRPQAGV